MNNKTKTIPKGYMQTEVGVIPEEWGIKKLSDVGDSIIGLTYSPRNVVNYGKLVHRSSNIQDNKLAYDDNVFVDLDINEKLILRENDILICVRNGSRNLIGKAALIKGRSISETFGAFMTVFRSNTYAPFIFYLIISDIVQRQINQSLGATINQIINKTLDNFQIPLPPREEEQTAIATILSDTDALIESLEKLIAKKRAIKQGIRRELLTGKRRLPCFTGEWEVESIEQLCLPNQLVRGPFGGSLKKEFFVESGIKVYEQKNAIYRDEKIGTYYIDNSKFNELKRFELNEGDFIVSCSGTIGRIFQIPRNYEKGIINQALLKIRTDESVINDQYFYYYFDWEKFQTRIIDNTQGGAMKNLVGMSIFKNTKIAIPPTKSEQIAIATVLSDIDTEIEALEQKLTKYKRIKIGMMQNLLTGKIRVYEKQK